MSLFVASRPRKQHGKQHTRHVNVHLHIAEDVKFGTIISDIRLWLPVPLSLFLTHYERHLLFINEQKQANTTRYMRFLAPFCTHNHSLT